MVRPLLATAALLLAAPATAAAADYCVGVPGYCPAGSTQSATLGQALAAAQASVNTADTVHVGPGTYTTPTGFTYDAGNNPANGLVIDGDGPDEVRLEADTPAKPAGFATLALHGAAVATDAVLATGLTVVAPNGAGDTTGVTLHNARMEYFDVHDDGTKPGGAHYGLLLQEGGTVRFGTVTMNRGAGVQAVSAVGNGARAEDVALSGQHGFYATGAITAHLSRADIEATSFGIASFDGASVYGDNSLVRVGTSGSGVIASRGEVEASNLTVLGQLGGANDTSIGLRAVSKGAKGAVVEVDNTIVRAAPVGVKREDDLGAAQATVTTWSSSISGDELSGGDGSITHHDRVLETPLFVDPKDDGGDFHQLADSPLLDRGGNPFVSGLSLDLDGLDRVKDARPLVPPALATWDLGAYEYQANAPYAEVTGPEAVAPGGTATFGPGASNGRDPGDQLTYGWTSSDGGSATGETFTHTFATAGEVLVTLTVTDPTGQKAAKTVAVQVAAPVEATPTPSPSPSPEPTAEPSSSPTPVATATPDRTAPTVRATRRGKRLRITLSEPARVRVRVTRRRTVSRLLPAGRSTVRVGRRRGVLRITATDAAGNAKRIRVR